MSDAVRYTPDELAAAIQRHIFALRILDRELTSIASIADALHITDFDVQATMEGFKIVGAKIDADVKVSHVRHGTTFSQVVRLKWPRKRRAR